MIPTTKAALEELLRQRRLAPEAPPLRGERRLRPLSTGHAELDARLGGGLPRGRLSEAFGPASSGRTGLALAVLARVTGTGGLAAWVDPCDRLDPASAAAAGVHLDRLLWLRGATEAARAAPDATRAVAILLGSGLFDLVVLDLAAAASRELRLLPSTTWVRLQRNIESADAALLLLAAEHVAKGPGGVSLAFSPQGPRFEGRGAGRLLVSLRAEVRPGPLALRGAALELPATPWNEPRRHGGHGETGA
ncbi:MAG TPA: hypothetical protein VFM88_13590 [Vicinamibacteria bacterium]|nr:hypothetical protein [Vicinamibacteria bacterium]